MPSFKRKNALSNHSTVQNEEMGLPPRKRQKAEQSRKGTNDAASNQTESKSKNHRRMSKRQEEREIIRFIDDVDQLPWNLRWKADSILKNNNNSSNNQNNDINGGFEILSVETHDIDDCILKNNKQNNIDESSKCQTIEKKILPKNPQLPNRKAWKQNIKNSKSQSSQSSTVQIIGNDGNDSNDKKKKISKTANAIKNCDQIETNTKRKMKNNSKHNKPKNNNNNNNNNNDNDNISSKNKNKNKNKKVKEIMCPIDKSIKKATKTNKST